MIGDFELLREAAAALVAIPPDRRTDCVIELLRLLEVQRDVLRNSSTTTVIGRNARIPSHRRPRSRQHRPSPGG
jgi:hypothetical protein